MNLRQLEYFVTVVECGSFSKAAETLHIAQPALSQQVRKLEAELGVELLVRQSRGVVASQRGRTLARHARELLREAERVRNLMRAEDMSPVGNVALGIPSTINMVLGVPLIEQVKRELPLTRLKIVETLSGYVLEMLRLGQIDLAILCNVDRLPGMTMEKLLIEDLYLVAPPGWNFDGAPQGVVEFAALSQVDLILPGQPHGLRLLVEQHAREAGTEIHVGTEVDAISQIKRLVARGLGCTVLSHASAADLIQSGEVVARRIVKPAVQRITSIAHRVDRPLSPAALAVKQRTVRLIRSLIEGGLWTAALYPTVGNA